MSAYRSRDLKDPSRPIQLGNLDPPAHDASSIFQHVAQAMLPMMQHMAQTTFAQIGAQPHTGAVSSSLSSMQFPSLQDAGVGSTAAQGSLPCLGKAKENAFAATTPSRAHSAMNAITQISLNWSPRSGVPGTPPNTEHRVGEQHDGMPPAATDPSEEAQNVAPAAGVAAAQEYTSPAEMERLDAHERDFLAAMAKPVAKLSPNAVCVQRQVQQPPDAQQLRSCMQRQVR